MLQQHSTVTPQGHPQKSNRTTPLLNPRASEATTKHVWKLKQDTCARNVRTISREPAQPICECETHAPESVSNWATQVHTAAGYWHR